MMMVVVVMVMVVGGGDSNNDGALRAAQEQGQELGVGQTSSGRHSVLIVPCHAPAAPVTH